MPAFICETCGTQFAPSSAPPPACPICEDERQYIGWNGQTWTTHDALAAKHELRLQEEDGVLAIGLDPAFAINQRALLLQTDTGNILWECLSIVTNEAVAALRARGGVDMIAISHPHFYTSMVEWSDAFGGVPILIHEADKEWVQRPSPAIRHWSGEDLELSDSVTLIQCGGHFDGSAALHWRDGPRPGGALFPGDALQVAQDRRHVAFMYSYPNYMPMAPSAVRMMRDRLVRCEFEDVFGFTWKRNIIGGGRAAVDRSFDRYLAAVAAAA
jgi:hypothetical protein